MAWRHRRRRRDSSTTNDKPPVPTQLRHPHLPRQPVSFKVRCQGKMHPLTLMPTGRLVIHHDHDALSSKVFDCLNENTRNRCQEVFKAWKHASLDGSHNALRFFTKKLWDVRRERRNRELHRMASESISDRKWSICSRFASTMEKAIENINYKVAFATLLGLPNEKHIHLWTHVAHQYNTAYMMGNNQVATQKVTGGSFDDVYTATPGIGSGYEYVRGYRVHFEFTPTMRWFRNVHIGNCSNIDGYFCLDIDSNYGATTRQAVVLQPYLRRRPTDSERTDTRYNYGRYDDSHVGLRSVTVNVQRGVDGLMHITPGSRLHLERIANIVGEVTD